MTTSSFGRCMTNDEVRAAWGDECLLKLPASALSEHNPSSDTHSILVEVGVPKEGPLSVSFYGEPASLQQLNIDETEYLVVGNDQGTKICIQQRTDEVWSLDSEHRLPSRFINSSLRCFVTCLWIYRTHEEQLKAASDDQARALTEKMRISIRAIDARAVADPENWWSVILEQVELGLM